MDCAHERVKKRQALPLFGVPSIEGKDEWLTPPAIVWALGPFDLDPCAPVNRPWDTAARHYTIEDDGLSKEWQGRVWCNPPYGDQTGRWLRKCARHGDAVALVFARTETRMFFDEVWEQADALFFFRGRLHFYHVGGERGGTAGAPSVLIAYGANSADRLFSSGLDGKAIRLKTP